MCDNVFRCAGLWRDYVWAYRNWVSASAVQRLEWTETTSKLSSSAPQGAEELGNLYRASFYCAILERFPLVLMSTASRSFWNGSTLYGIKMCDAALLPLERSVTLFF